MATVTYASYFKWSALLHFMRTDPQMLDMVSQETWTDAASAMLQVPDPNDGDFEAAIKLVARIATQSAGATEEAFRIALDGAGDQGAAFTRKLRDAWNSRLVRMAIAHAENGRLATQVARDVLSSLLLHGQSVAKDYVNTCLKRANDGNGLRRQLAIASAQAVLATGGPTEFEHVWPLIEGDVKAGLEVLGADTPHSESAPAPLLVRLREAQVADVFLWLARNRPKHPPERFGFIGRDERLEELERHCLDRLRTAGTVEAVEEIARIRRAMPDTTWLQLTEDDVQRTMRAAIGHRPTALQVLRMADDRAQRYVSCEADLLAVVLSSLQSLNGELTDTDPLVRFLWSLDPLKPRDEIDLCIFITRHLRRELGGRAIVLNREVNISRINRTDIRVETTAPAMEGERPLTLTIEVKGSWHRELMTAMETQLRDQYLAASSAKVGLYVVGWFRSDGGIGGGGPSLSVEEARLTFEAQATRLSAAPYLLRSFVLDCTWREERPKAEAPGRPAP